MKVTSKPETVYSKTLIVYIAEIVKTIYNLAGSVGVGYLLYDNCLKCSDCNPFVIVYMSIVSLGYFCAMGIPIEKFINIESIK